MNNPLVSVCVISYNSEDTIIETLESIKNQTYSPIEFILSDDCSKDNTVSLAQEWITKNSSRFENTQLITTVNNTGVSANVNRAYKAAHGTYIKDISADDILLPSYLIDCISYMQSNPNIKVLFTKVLFFNKENTNIPDESIIDYNFFHLSVQEQFKQIILNGVPCIPTPSVIYKAETIKSIGYFDEKIPMWEDGPMYFILTKNGIKLFLLDKKDLLNRVRSDSLSHAAPLSHRRSEALFYKYDIFKYEFHIRPLKSLFHLFKSYLLYHSDIPVCNKMLFLLSKK